MKAILITNIPTPYRLPLWDILNNQINIKVICISDNEKNRQWDIENRSYIHFLKSYHFFFQKKDWALHFSIPFSLFFLLRKQNPDAIIITGYDSLQFWEAFFYAKIYGKKKILWNGSTLLSSRSQNKVVNRIKKYFINSFDSYYTYGSKATEYIESFGVDSQKIITGTNTVDSDFYKHNTKDEVVYKNRVNFLFVGQLIERKGLKNTIEAFSKISHQNWKLTIVGSGPDENMFKKQVIDYHLDDKIKFVGFKQKNEIIDYYSEADVFLMPSYLEVWGLVLNEALASGLFCLASKYAGATFDLIKEGENGLVIDPKNVDDLVHKIDMVFERNFDKKSIKNSFDVSYEKETQKIIEAIKKATS